MHDGQRCSGQSRETREKQRIKINQKSNSELNCLLVQVLDRLLFVGEAEVRSLGACEEKIRDLSPGEADPRRQLDLHVEHLFRTRSKELQSILRVKEKRVGVLLVVSNHRLECVNLPNERKKIGISL